MLTHRLPTHVETVAQLPQRQSGPLMKHVEQPTTAGVRKRFENEVRIHSSIMQVNTCILQRARADSLNSLDVRREDTLEQTCDDD